MNCNNPSERKLKAIADFSVSVIIPTHDRRKELHRALNSIFNQTWPADEVIVIDDGSKDDTKQTVTDSFPQVKYISQENLGVSAARNTGIKMASSQWLAFLDSDDEWLPKKLEKQIVILKQNPNYHICHTNEIWIRKGKRVNPKRKHEKYGGFIFDKCLPLCVISPSSVIIHNSIFRKYGGFDISLPVCEDYDFWLRTCAFLPVLYIKEALIVKYGGHHDQLSNKFWGMDRFRIYALEKIIYDSRLNIHKRIAAIQMLLQKIDIYLNGVKKRNKKEEIDLYTQKKKMYQKKLESILDQSLTGSSNGDD
jgi:glycosyltransferase involved in cell wall biosynthesis